MQITIDLPPDLEHDLMRQADETKVPLAELVLQALRQGIQTVPTVNSQWPDLVLSYEGIPDFPAFECSTPNGPRKLNPSSTVFWIRVFQNCRWKAGGSNHCVKPANH